MNARRIFLIGAIFNLVAATALIVAANVFIDSTIAKVAIIVILVAVSALDTFMGAKKLLG